MGIVLCPGKVDTNLNKGDRPRDERKGKSGDGSTG